MHVNHDERQPTDQYPCSVPISKYLPICRPPYFADCPVSRPVSRFVCVLLLLVCVMVCLLLRGGALRSPVRAQKVMRATWVRALTWSLGDITACVVVLLGCTLAVGELKEDQSCTHLGHGTTLRDRTVTTSP
jgi:hypothetical protein